MPRVWKEEECLRDQVLEGPTPTKDGCPEVVWPSVVPERH